MRIVLSLRKASQRGLFAVSSVQGDLFPETSAGFLGDQMPFRISWIASGVPERGSPPERNTPMTQRVWAKNRAVSPNTRKRQAGISSDTIKAPLISA